MDAKDTLDLVMVRKLYDMLDSEQADGNVARTKLMALLGKHGKRVRDLPEMLGKGTSAGAAPMDDAALWRDMWQTESRLRAESDRKYDREKERASAWQDIAFEEAAKRQQAERQTRERDAKEKQAKAAAEQAERRRRNAEEARAEAAEEAADAKERDAVIKWYGSVAALLVPCDREKLLKAAVRQWSKFYTHDAPEWTSSICRCTSLESILGRKKPLTHVMDAISQAYPRGHRDQGAVGGMARPVEGRSGSASDGERRHLGA
jgi:hypothetical protein